MHTIEQLREMHDTDLKKVDQDEARAVLAGRDRAERQLRLTVACMYGRGDMMTFSHWGVVPCLTGEGTIGVLDITQGIAWDSAITADTGVADLGLTCEVYAGANGHGGTVSFNGAPVQVDGTAVVDGKVMPPTMPAGWRQIALPTWRKGDLTSLDYRPVTWIQPRLVAAGLTTCYGKPGTDDGAYLARCHGWERTWPWGVPAWIDGASVSVVCLLPDVPRIPRGTDEQECAVVARFVEKGLDLTAARCRATVASVAHYRQQYGRRVLDVDQIEMLPQLADQLAARDLGADDSVLRAIGQLGLLIGNATNGSLGGSELQSWTEGLRRAQSALQDGRPWDAAQALSNTGELARLLSTCLVPELLGPAVDGTR